MIIACDIDGCLADFNRGYGALFPDHEFPFHDPNFPAMWHWPQHYGISNSVVHAAWRKIKSSTTFWENLKPTLGATDGLSILNAARSDGHEIYFLTTRSGRDCKGQTWRWLKQYGFSDPSILVSASTPQAKGYVCLGLGVDVIIDDRSLNLNNTYDPTRRYIVDAAYNRAPRAPSKKYTRVDTVWHALKEEGLT